jgi:hypothetical protein
MQISLTQDAHICHPMARGQKQIEPGANSLAPPQFAQKATQIVNDG